jgi:hypothetical protein
MRGLIIIAAVVALLPLPEGERVIRLAQTAEPAPPAPTDDPSLHSYGDRDKTCIAWSDQCRSCERGANDAIFCSNIGIACQPAAVTCSRRSEPAK